MEAPTICTYSPKQKKLAYEDRAKFYADPDFNDIPVEELISKAYAKERNKLISMEKAARFYPPGDIGSGETIYMTVADKEGNMVSLIQSNYRGMGSGMTPTDLGFVLQNRGGELFSLEKGHLNVFEPEKRPFHTIIPAFITKDGKPYISFGLMGGGMQPQGHVQIVVNLIDFGMNLQEAGDAPRIQHVMSSEPTGYQMKDGGWINLETGIDYEVIRELMERGGHRVKYDLGGYGAIRPFFGTKKTGGYIMARQNREKMGRQPDLTVFSQISRSKNSFDKADDKV